MTIKKKPLIITIAVILALILVTSIFFLFTNKNVNIKATRIDGVTSDLKDAYQNKDNKYAQNKLFIESSEELKTFLSKFEEQDYVTNLPESFEKYDEKFFKKKVLFVLQSSNVTNHMRLDHINKSYISKNNLVIEDSIYIIVSEEPVKFEIGSNLPAIGFPRTFIYEIPEGIINRYELEPQNIKFESIYKGVSEEEYNEKYR